MLIQAKNFAIARIAGTDARALLQRITTNNAPAKGQGCLTFLLADGGRIEGAAYLVATEEDEFIAFGGAGLIAGFIGGIDKYKLRDQVDAYLVVGGVYAADQEGAAVFGKPLPDPWPTEGFVLLADAEAEKPLFVAGPGWFGRTVWALTVADWPTPTWVNDVDLSESTYDAAMNQRVMLGWPELGYEVQLGDLPLEWDLGWGIAIKGCYVGQEVIERMWTRGRRSRGRMLVSAADSMIDGADIRRNDWTTEYALGLRKASGPAPWQGDLDTLPASLRLGFDAWAEQTK